MTMNRIGDRKSALKKIKKKFSITALFKKDLRSRLAAVASITSLSVVRISSLKLGEQRLGRPFSAVSPIFSCFRGSRPQVLRRQILFGADARPQLSRAEEIRREEHEVATAPGSDDFILENSDGQNRLGAPAVESPATVLAKKNGSPKF